jgi:hypothetical protein
MNITSLLHGNSSGLSANSKTSSQGSAEVDSALKMLQGMDQKLQARIDASKTQISSYGAFKSSLSQVQISAQGLTGLTEKSSAADLTKAMGNFFNAFNAVASSATTAESSSGTSTGKQSAQRTMHEMVGALKHRSALLEDLHTLGLIINSNGTLAQDTKKFAASLAKNQSGVQKALAELGRSTAAAATGALADTGAAGSGLSGLNTYQTNLMHQQKAVKTAEAALGKA